MKIFLNPGHGGADPGACSKTGTKEGPSKSEKSNLRGQRFFKNSLDLDFQLNNCCLYNKLLLLGPGTFVYLITFFFTIIL